MAKPALNVLGSWMNHRRCVDEAFALPGETGNEFPGLLHQLSEPFSLSNGFSRISAMLERVPVFFGRARTGRAAMHPTAPLASHRRRLAGAAFTGPGAASLAGEHWTGVA